MKFRVGVVLVKVFDGNVFARSILLLAGEEPRMHFPGDNGHVSQETAAALLDVGAVAVTLSEFMMHSSSYSSYSFSSSSVDG